MDLELDAPNPGRVLAVRPMKITPAMLEFLMETLMEIEERTDFLRDKFESNLCALAYCRERVGGLRRLLGHWETTEFQSSTSSTSSAPAPAPAPPLAAEPPFSTT